VFAQESTSSCSRGAVAPWLFLVWFLGVFFPHCQASAHELAIDQVSLWPDVGGKLRGQLSFDPELTRSLDQKLPPAEASRRVLAFVRRQLVIEIDGKRCDTDLEVRELYIRGGAVPGDIVMLDCALPKTARQIRVKVGREFAQLAVTIGGFGVKAAGASAGRQSVLVNPGGASPSYFIGRASSEFWRTGGAEQFNPPAAPSGSVLAPTVVSVGEKVSDPVPQVVHDAEAQRPGFAQPGVGSVIWRYLWVGFAHILPKGWDHVLFVTALSLGAGRNWRRLVLELSLFTAAHTLTLALGALDVVLVAPRVIEPLIAASIGYVAAENLLGRTAPRSRLLIVFVFGLVHGQGFAGALSQLALPSSALVSALLGFNLGVELGQLVVAGSIAAFVVLVPTGPPKQAVALLASFASLAIACYWVLQRVFG
jgi:hypothetical protein